MNIEKEVVMNFKKRIVMNIEKEGVMNIKQDRNDGWMVDLEIEKEGLKRCILRRKD